MSYSQNINSIPYYSTSDTIEFANDSKKLAEAINKKEVLNASVMSVTPSTTSKVVKINISDYISNNNCKGFKIVNLYGQRDITINYIHSYSTHYQYVKHTMAGSFPSSLGESKKSTFLKCTIDGCARITTVGSDYTGLDINIPQFSGVIFFPYTGAYLHDTIEISYTSDFDGNFMPLSFYLFDQSATDGIGQNAKGQVAVGDIFTPPIFEEGIGIYGKTLIMKQMGRPFWESLTVGGGTSSSKTLNTNAVSPYEILYFDPGHNYKLNVCEATKVGELRDEVPEGFDLRYSLNLKHSLTSYHPVYMVGEYRDGAFIIGNEGEPTTYIPEVEYGIDTNNVYIYIGQSIDSYTCTLAPTHPIRIYKNGAVREFVDLELVENATYNSFVNKVSPLKVNYISGATNNSFTYNPFLEDYSSSPPTIAALASQAYVPTITQGSAATNIPLSSASGKMISMGQIIFFYASVRFNKGQTITIGDSNNKVYLSLPMNPYIGTTTKEILNGQISYSYVGSWVGFGTDAGDLSKKFSTPLCVECSSTSNKVVLNSPFVSEVGLSNTGDANSGIDAVGWFFNAR